jgi:hypothetical protein
MKWMMNYMQSKHLEHLLERLQYGFVWITATCGYCVYILYV